MKKQLLSVLLVLMISGGSFLTYIILKKDTVDDSFKRIIKKPELVMTNVFHLPDASFSFAGRPDEEILFYSYKFPGVLYVLNKTPEGLTKQVLKMPEKFNMQSNYFKYDRYSAKIYVSNAEGDLAEINSNKSFFHKMPMINSDLTLAISNRSVVARSLENRGAVKQMALVKLELSDSISISHRYDLPKHGDGYFGNDGILRYDQRSARLFYMYSYIGKICCLDTNLNVLFNLKTIDTITVPKIKLGVFTTKLKDGTIAKQLTQITPPPFVNRDFFTNNDRIYVMSALKTGGQENEIFSKHQIVDIYNMNNGNYICSFYLPGFQHYRARKCEVQGDKLLVLYDKYLVVYQFDSY